MLENDWNVGQVLIVQFGIPDLKSVSPNFALSITANGLISERFPPSLLYISFLQNKYVYLRRIAIRQETWEEQLNEVKTGRGKYLRSGSCRTSNSSNGELQDR